MKHRALGTRPVKHCLLQLDTLINLPNVLVQPRRLMIASAIVGSPRAWYQTSRESWLITMVDLRL